MKKVGRKVVSVLLTLCMLLTMLPVSALAVDEGTVVDTAPAETNLAEPANNGNSSSDDSLPVSTLGTDPEGDADVSVEYVDENKVARTCTDYTVVTSSDTVWSAGWYVVTDTVNLTSRVQVSGNVYLILTDGAALNANKGIGVTAGNSLTIYGQSAGTGRLTAGAYQVGSAAAIGGNNDSGAHGNITINGGEINATGASDAAGIGGGMSATETSGTITINDGVVNATSGGNGAGIGGGYANTTNGGDITITGGNVTAVGGIWAAGIGTGYYGTGMKITITGGTVNATGGSDDTFGGAGIGAGYSTASGAALASITITGGDVTAKGGSGAAGIGSGSGPNAAVGAIEISGSAEVHAIGGNSDTYAGAGIGAGGYDDCGSITISGGAKVTATGGTGSSYGGAGIGAGGKGPCDSITIGGRADVTAVGGAGDTCGGAGIGAGGGRNIDIIDGTYRPIPSCNRIEITGGTVNATGSGDADGIGGNGSTSSTVGSVSISGGAFSANTFDGGIPEDYLADGFTPVENEDGTWGVKEDDTTTDTGVAQIGDKTYATLEQAFDVVTGSEPTTIKLIADTQISSTIEILEGKNITLDLNGCAVTVPAAGSDGRSLYAISNNGTLTICDNSTEQDGSITARGIQNIGNGILTINSGTFVSCDANGGAAVWNEATAYINGGTFKTMYVGSASDNYGPGCLNNSGTAVITAGTFESVNKRTYAVISTGTITITPAEGKEVIVSGAHGGLAVDSGVAVVNGGSFSSTEYYGLYVSNDGQGEDPMQAAVTVNGGTFTGANYSVWIGSDYNNPVNSTIAIHNGIFMKPLNAQSNTREGAVQVYGGTFYQEVPPEYCAEGFVPQKNADGTWGVVKKDEAEINGKQYATLSEALNAVKGGETIKILAPATVNMTKTYAITGKAITLDLNGQTVTWKSSAKNMIEIGTDGGLTIQDATDAGVLHFIGTGTTSYGSGIYTSGNGSLSLTGGTVLYEHSKAGYGLNITGSSTFTMTGGTVKIAGAVNYAVRLASTSQCQLNGGKILFDEGTTATTLYGVHAVLYSSAGEDAGFSLGNLAVDGSMVPDTKTVYCVYGYNDGTPVTISGGTYTANDKSASYAVGGGNSNATSISGGTFNGAVKAAIGKVTGGQFSVQPSAAYLPEGKIYELQQDGYYYVVDGTYVARLGTVGYTSWDALWKDASGGTTASAVYILADVKEITVPAGKNVTFYNSGNCAIGKITNNGTCKIISYAMTGTEVVNNGSLNLGHEVKSLVNNQGATMEATSYTYAKVTDSITNSGTMTISKGTYPCAITNTGTITLTGGSFAQKVTDWCADGYTTQNSGDLWVVVKNGDHVAEIDGYWYTSLSAAINAAKDGDTVKLLMDTTLTPTTTGTGLKSAITISGVSKPNLTLDLNGKTISWDQTYADQTLSSTPVMFSISGGANITITGNGTIDTELGSNTSYGINMTTSTKNQLTIENGTFTGAPTAIQVEKGTLTILDGTFKLAKTVATDKPEQAKYVVNAIDANWNDDSANISIQGGSFCFDPSNNPEGEGSSYVAEGFEAVVNADGSFEIAKVKVAEVGGVQYTSLADAIKNVASGGTITLLCDFVQNDQLTITDKTFTLDMAGKNIILGKISDGAGAILLDGSSNVTITGNGGFTFNDDYFADSSGQMIGVDGNATLTIENGNFYAGLVCVRAGESAKVYIKGGEYSAYAKFDGRVWLLNLQDNEGAKFYVSGGTFKNYDPTNSDTESPADNFCTPEYAATPTTDESGNTIYTVVEAEARIGETGYVTLADAIAAAGDNDTITLLANVTEDVVVPTGKNITLGLNEHKITNVADHTITVKIGATLAITGTGTVDNVTHAKAAIWNEGTVTLDGGAYTRSQETGTGPDVSGTNSYYNIVNHGTMTINSGVSVTQNGGFSSMIENGYYSYNSGNASSGYVAGVNAVNPELTINGGTFSGGLNTVKNDDGGKLTINDGTFTNTTQATVLNWNIATIAGGTFTAGSGNCLLNGAFSTSASAQDLGQMTITGGSFTSPEGTACIVNYLTDSLPEISGGTFSEKPDDTYLVDGYAPEQNDEGDWVVVEENFVAEIVDGQKYESLIEAVEAATAGQTVKLLANVELQPVENQDYVLMIDANQSMTLDLNGHKITATLNNTAEFNLIKNYGELTITDTSEGKGGSIEVTENGSHDSARTSILYNGYDTGKFTLEAGTLKLTGSANSKKPLYGVYSSGTTVVMNGGAIEVRREKTSDGGSTNGKHWDVYGIYNSNNCQTTVNDGTITVENQGRHNSAYGINNASGTVSIHGDPNTPYIEANAFDDGIWYEHTLYGKITLYGGKYNMQTDTATGWIKSDIIIADGYEDHKNGDGTVSIIKSPVAQIGSTKYHTLEEAVAHVQPGETITMLTDVEEGSGIIVPSGSNFTIDFAGHTYKVVGNLAGSTGTESQCFQLLRDSNITMKNGTIVANNSGITMIIQNYANLTLDDMTLDATQGINNVGYVMSNNCGNVTITGDTDITAKTTGVAFDVYYWPSGSYVEGVTVTVDENMTGTITGKIEYAADDTAQDADVAEKAKLNIEAGTFIGSIVTTETNHGISISGGSFSEEPNKDYLAPYYAATQNTTGDNYWTVDVAANIEAIWITEAATKPGMLSDLLTEADSGTVQLLKDVTATNVIVSDPVTLDLNGNTLTATVVAMFDGAVVDSTEGKGLLKVGVTRNDPNVTLKENNPSLLIYDSDAAGYRLYSYTFEKLRAYTTDQSGNSMGFYFQLTFENLAAWGKLNTAETTHGVIMSTVLGLPNGTELIVYFDQSTIQGVAGSIVDGAAQTGKGFWLTVTGLNKLEAGQTLKVTPTLEAAGDKLVINTEAFEYSKSADESN